MNFLVLSLVASVFLTVLLNVALWLFPDSGRRLEERIEETFERRADAADNDAPRVRVYFPWRLMLIVSIGLTLVLNLLRWRR